MYTNGKNESGMIACIILIEIRKWSNQEDVLLRFGMDHIRFWSEWWVYRGMLLNEVWNELQNFNKALTCLSYKSKENIESPGISIHIKERIFTANPQESSFLFSNNFASKRKVLGAGRGIANKPS